MLIKPESEHCWANNRDKVARATPSVNLKDRELDVAIFLRYWALSGLVMNTFLTLCFIYALTVPCRRLELTWHGQVRVIRNVVLLTVFLLVLFIALTVSVRWEHDVMVCCGDLIPHDYYKEDGNGVPAFYFVDTGWYIKIYVYFYVGVFCVFAVIGALLTLWITYRTTFKEDRLPFDPDYVVTETDLRTDQVLSLDLQD